MLVIKLMLFSSVIHKNFNVADVFHKYNNIHGVVNKILKWHWLHKQILINFKVLIDIDVLDKELPMKRIKVEKKEASSQKSLWDEIPFYGREAMIATIDDEMELFMVLQSENEEEYNKLCHLRNNKQ